LSAIGWPIERALKAATLNSASVVRHADTQTGLLKLSALEAAIETEGRELAVREWSLGRD
jgi:hypothetical protein